MGLETNSADKFPKPELRRWNNVNIRFAWITITAVQIVLLLIDHVPRYSLGDSASYMWAIEHGGPIDRSWTYPAWFLRPLLSFHSITIVFYVQCALALAPPLYCWKLIRDGGRGSSVIAFVLAISCLVEPLALTYQRSILTDGLGAFFAATALFLCARLVEAKPWTYLAAAIAPPAMVLACSLRTSQAPSFALLAIFMVLFLAVAQRRLAACGVFLVTLVISQIVFSFNAKVHQGGYGYNAASGRFLLAAMMPLVTKEDVEPYVDPAKIPAILDARARNPRQRGGELFTEGRTIDQIHQAFPILRDETEVEENIAVHAMLRAPLGVARLTMETFLDYLDARRMIPRINEEVDRRPYESDELKFFQDFKSFGIVDTSKTNSFTMDVFLFSWRYYGWIPIASVFLLGAAVFVDRRASTLMLAAFAVVSAITHITFAIEPVPRYMIVSAWINLVVLGRLVVVLVDSRSRRRSAISA